MMKDRLTLIENKSMSRRAILVLLGLYLAVVSGGGITPACDQWSALYNAYSDTWWTFFPYGGDHYYLEPTTNSGYPTSYDKMFYRISEGSGSYEIRSVASTTLYLMAYTTINDIQFVDTPNPETFNITKKGDGLVNIGADNGDGYICVRLQYGTYVMALSQSTGSHCSYQEYCCDYTGCY